MDTEVCARFRVKSIPKSGNSPEQNEDAYFSHPKKGQAGTKRGRKLAFAVADGASEGFRTGEWASLLARAFYSQALQKQFSWKKFVSQARGSWHDHETGYVQVRTREGRPLRWYEEALIQAGACAALLGLVLRAGQEPRRGTWEAFAVGDCCLFQVRGDRLLSSFPLQSSEQFSNSPSLICSKDSPGVLEPVPERIRGSWQAGDCFFLLTDALAAWFLRECEAGAKPWAELKQPAKAKDDKEFRRWVDSLRAKGLLRNDDCTVTVIELKQEKPARGNALSR